MFLSCPLLALAQDAPLPVDPAVLSMPVKPPEFRELLQSASWDKAFADALKRLGELDALAKSAAPELGVRIDTVDLFKGQGGELGLKPGEVISEIDGAPVDADHWLARREDHEQVITVIGSDGQSRKLAIAPGKIGVNFSPFVRPELIYLRHGPRNPKWDALVAAGAASCTTNPDLAETAWHHAFKAGYPADHLSDYCEMQIAWRQGRSDEAVACCARFHARTPMPWTPSLETTTRQLALANFKIEQAMAMRMTPTPGDSRMEAEPGEFLQALLDAHRQLPEKQRCGPSPSEIAEYVKTNMLKEMEPRPAKNEPTNSFHRHVLDVLIKHDSLSDVSAPTAHYRLVPFIPKTDDENVELVVRATVHETDEKTSQFNKVFAVTLLDADPVGVVDNNARPPDTRFLNVMINPQGLCTINVHKTETVRVTTACVADEIADRRQFTLTLIHAAGREEVWIDRRRLLYLPAAKNPKKIGFQLDAVGVTTSIRADFSKLDPQLVPGS